MTITEPFDRVARTRQLPNGPNIVEAGYVLAGFGITRDSDPLEESNYAVAMRTLITAAGIDAADVTMLGQPWHDDTDADDAPAVTVARFGHWACGWIEELMVRADRADIIASADALRARLDDYPVLDEDDYCEREYAANHPDADTYCYSDDTDCGCGRERA